MTFGLEMEGDAHFPAAPVQQHQQLAPRQPREAVPRGLQAASLVVDVDVVPVVEPLLDGSEHRRVGLGHFLERGVREDDAEAEGLVGSVALEDLDPRGRGSSRFWRSRAVKSPPGPPPMTLILKGGSLWRRPGLRKPQPPPQRPGSPPVPPDQAAADDQVLDLGGALRRCAAPARSGRGGPRDGTARTPRPPRIWTERSTIRCAASVAERLRHRRFRP